MKKQLSTTNAMILTVGVSAFFMLGQMNVSAQQSVTTDPGTDLIDAGTDSQTSDYVTINVKNANISEVLKAYSLQTGQSIVVGPDVVSDNVNVRLNNIPWQEALDVILKPYGFGYRVVGDTIVISKLENIVTVEGIEPLASKVFTLKYLDAYDIKDVCEAQLTSRGKFTIQVNKGLPGWEFSSGESAGSGATEAAGVRRRAKKEQIQKSKTFVITDVPASLTAISDIIEELDVPPVQVLIEARFMEVNMDNLSDIGLDLLSAMESVSGPLLDSGTGLQPVDGGGNVLNPIQALTDPLVAGTSGMYSHDNGLRLSYSKLGDTGFDMLFKLEQSDNNVNILSAPRILTLDNQEAAILVGRKYPIIRSQTGGGNASSQSTITLDYYENIGIQLNVLPQVSDGDYINMVVHPVVSEIEGFTDGSVNLLESDITSSTKYPIMTVREAETQILLKSDETAVIGGLQTQKDSIEVKKVPILGDIPFLGRLFRREIKGKTKIDLLIFLKATVVDRESYASDSAVQQHDKEVEMGLAEETPVEMMDETGSDTNAIAAPVTVEEEEPMAVEAEKPMAVEAEEPMAVEEASQEKPVENEEILSLVRGMNTTNSATGE